MSKIKVCVHGLGNIGRYSIEALEAASDMECVGVVRRPSSIGKNKVDLRGVDEYPSIEELIKAKGKPDVCLIATPSRHAFDDDSLYLKHGIHTIDSFDIHTEIPEIVEKLEKVAKENNAVSVTAAGWDPGSDSVMRAMLEAMMPVGVTFTNFGRGRSMGHSAAARAVEGIKDAVSITIPMGGGRHSRLVYVVLEDGVSLEEAKKRLAADDYFAHDPLDVKAVADSDELAMVCDSSHGVLMERQGASGLTDNQRMTFKMEINNPALTSQIMVSCARAATRLNAGCYTMIDIPPVLYLNMDRKTAIKKLV